MKAIRIVRLLLSYPFALCVIICLVAAMPFAVLGALIGGETFEGWFTMAGDTFKEMADGVSRKEDAGEHSYGTTQE